MQKNKRWQLFIIIMVLSWTIYTILPTIIYAFKPLSSPIEKKDATSIEQTINTRIDTTTEETKNWLENFCSLVNVHPHSIHIDPDRSALITLSVSGPDEIAIIEKFLPKAGALIPEKGAKISIASIDGNTIYLTKKNTLPSFSTDKSFFSFIEKRNQKSGITPEYSALIKERFLKLYQAIAKNTPHAALISAAINSHDKKALAETAEYIQEIYSQCASSPFQIKLLQNLFSDQNPQEEAGKLLQTIEQELVSLKNQTTNTTSSINEETTLLSTEQLEQKKNQQQKIELYSATASILKKIAPSLQNTNIPPYTETQCASWFNANAAGHEKTLPILQLKNTNPFLSGIGIDWKKDIFVLQIDPEIISALQPINSPNEEKIRTQDYIRKLLLNEISTIAMATNESFKEDGSIFFAPLTQTTSNGLMVFSLKNLGNILSKSLCEELELAWAPESVDFAKKTLPWFSFAEFEKGSKEDTRLCIIIGTPTGTTSDLKPQSLYVIIHGGLHILSRNNTANEHVQKDLQKLISILQQKGFLAYSGKIFGPQSPYANDIIFEQEAFYEPFIETTKEAFYVPGSSNHAYLDLGTVKDRITAENRIDAKEQEERIQWKESYDASKVSLNPEDHFLVPKPSKNLFLSNLKRSWTAFWRGDEDKVLKWGLDLSGGKSVRIGLLDQANKPVTSEASLRQASSELYARLNKMGVSERTIRIENDTLVIDFPGVSNMSASDLLKASAMYFHIVNEKFSPYNDDLAKATNNFLQQVWNEAVVSNIKDIDAINALALRKIEAVSTGTIKDTSISTLLESGLVLCNPGENKPTTAFDDTTSMIARFQGDDPSHWYGQNHPLLIVLKNYALEGANLENVQATYDVSKGNILVFNVRSKASNPTEDSPQETFYTWTSQFSQEGILGTSREQATKGRGWRMAVILNGNIINAPSLSSSLKDSAMITGNFTQREAQKLATSLKAGSLSFTPKILSEQNISPELGAKERTQGLTAAIVATIVVIGVMCVYYRFAGFVASVAVIFNILIIWAVMQNIDAAITLPSLAGIVLTVAMAVDANVLVFERIREEFAVSNRIASAIHLGYEKAFSAITDSNLTTIIAAFILTQFDCGPVRGFAITLIIGLLSSMFTSLFVTKYYFSRWAENPDHKSLSMANWIEGTNFDFLAWKKVAIFLTLGIFIVGTIATGFTYKSILGMDFTGGYALIVEVSSPNDQISPKEMAEKALIQQGITPSEIQIRELGRKTLLRIQLSSSLEEKNHPFHNLPQTVDGSTEYQYQTIPRLDWVVKSLEKGGLAIRKTDKTSLAQHWTSISGQFSDTMRNNALLALGLSIVAILIYIAIRFEMIYAISAVLALLHDVLLTLASIAILRLFGVPIQINLEVIGALMTIIGYALNDTIIIFDRVREDVHLYRKKNFSQIVTMALNSTLSRTVLTSGITLLVLLCLVIMGGPSLFGFSFVMFLGVFLGTLSSLFIAGPLLLFFHKKDHHSIVQ